MLFTTLIGFLSFVTFSYNVVSALQRLIIFINHKKQDNWVKCSDGGVDNDDDDGDISVLCDTV